jgi:hypothetical protein
MFVNTICVIIMNKTLNNLYIKTTKENKANVFAIHMSREMQPNKNQSCMQYTYPIRKFCVVADNISPEINNLSVVYRYLCIVYIISHLLEEMYEIQIFILLKCHVLPRCGVIDNVAILH